MNDFSILSHIEQNINKQIQRNSIMNPKLILSTIMLVSFTTAVFAQSDTKSDKEARIEESLKNIKKEIESIKKNIDTSKLREISKRIGKSAEEIGDALEDIADEAADKADEMEKKNGPVPPPPPPPPALNGDKSQGAKKPVQKRRTKMYFDLSFGLSGLTNNNTAVAGRVYPEYKTWGSNFWDVGLKFRTRLGGNNSPAFLTYGLNYNITSLESDNDTKLILNNGKPEFVKLDNAKSSELNIGYITLPVGLEFKFAKKAKFGIGGFAGYRVRTRQNIDRREDYEDVNETRIARYGLNNVMYGTSVRLGYGGIVLVGKYNMSPLFEKDNKDYKYNMYNVGLNFSF